MFSVKERTLRLKTGSNENVAVLYVFYAKYTKKGKKLTYCFAKSICCHSLKSGKQDAQATKPIMIMVGFFFFFYNFFLVALRFLSWISYCEHCGSQEISSQFSLVYFPSS